MKKPDRRDRGTFGVDDAASIGRRRFLEAGTCGASAALAALPLAKSTESFAERSGVKPFELEETTLAHLQTAMTEGRLTARSITEKYLARIDEIDKLGPAVNAVLEINPDALSIAEALDRERKAKGPRGPLHGIPILVKDNIGTADRMTTTAGSLALAGFIPPRDAFVVEQLRRAGAVILGKANMSEWASFRSSHSTSGWSGRGGQVHNPYALDRNPCGSSSGSAVAVSANLCALALGTETDGSVICPSSVNGIVGIKPTQGLVSRAGVIPASHTQDVVGPMGRTVTDAATLLGILAGVDPRDPVTATSRGKAFTDYTRFLDPKGLKGARIGVARYYFGYNGRLDKLMEESIALIKAQGATVIDPAPIANADKFPELEFTILMYELKADLNAYLAAHGSKVPVHSLQKIIEFNRRHWKEEMPYFGQELFLEAQAKGPLTSKEYREALAASHELTRVKGLDATMDRFKLDALVAPSGGPAWMTDLVNGDHDPSSSTRPGAMAGYPSVTVPAGFIFGLPTGISFMGRAYSEPKLIQLAYAFEQASRARRAPKFLPTADLKV